MKRLSILALAFTLLAFPAQAKDINVKSLGAKADGKTKVTKTIQKAIDAVSAAGGGRVTLSGGTFLSGPIEIKSGVELFIDADAVLLASPDIADPPTVPMYGIMIRPLCRATAAQHSFMPMRQRTSPSAAAV